MLTAVLGLVHSFRGEDKCKLSVMEPAMIAAWFANEYLFRHFFHYAGILVTGTSMSECAVTPYLPLMAKIFCPTSGNMYWLLLIVMARVFVIGWHQVTSLFRKAWEPLLQVLLLGIVLAFIHAPGIFDDLNAFPFMFAWQVGSGTYMLVYIVCLYWGPLVLPRREWIKGPWYIVCPILLALHIVGLYLCVEFHRFPPYDTNSKSTWDTTLTELVQIPAWMPLFMCFLKLPQSFDIHLDGPMLLGIFLIHEFLRDWVNRGIHLHGLKVFPSLPDLLVSVGNIAGGLQLLVAILYVIFFMQVIIYVFVYPAIFLFTQFAKLCQPLVANARANIQPMIIHKIGGA
jgi:hypothetical protein